MKRLEDAGVLQLLRPSDNVAACDDDLDAATEALEPPLEETSYPVYHLGGGMHLFPEDVALPSGSAEQAWGIGVVVTPQRLSLHTASFAHPT
ncbi:hypothetical protein PI125_g27155 [Phytophthora idaei]|nr:hypothetical protein PI125_g27155 [Phytophthora idaei]